MRKLAVVATLFMVFGSACGASVAPSNSVGATDAATEETDSTPDVEPEQEPSTTTSPTEDTDDESTNKLPEPVYPTGLVPTRIEIPQIDVDASVIDLDLRGPEPEVPEDFDDTGWYQQTREPGEIGPAVIAGHIDSQEGPAVFAKLDQLEPGDEIIVSDEQANNRTFIVVSSGQYPKDSLPDEVFGFDLPEPELRLITCGGTFDRSSGHYQDNYVVYATQSGDASR